MCPAALGPMGATIIVVGKKRVVGGSFSGDKESGLTKSSRNMVYRGWVEVKGSCSLGGKRNSEE